MDAVLRGREPSGRTAGTEIGEGNLHSARRATRHPGADAEPSSPAEADEFRRDVLLGLRQPQKRIPSKYFYDEAGSTLFDRICALDEYYVTRTEMSIMREHAPEMAARLGAGRLILEYGSGTSTKTYSLLEHLPRPAAYAPIDVAEEHLSTAAGRIARDFPGLTVLPICADFTQPFAVPDTGGQALRRAVYFPGSTIGNFTPAEAARLLRLMAETCGEGGAALIGVDLRKPLEILGPAYDDAQGVTAAFNLNVLRRANRELGADFDLEAFRHAPRWNEAESRIEMHLESAHEQSACISGERFAFAPGETILTEYSHKFTLDGFASLARSAGLDPVQVWTDPQAWFAVFYLDVTPSIEA